MNIDRLSVRILHAKEDGKRRSGWQRKMWVDNVKEYLTRLDSSAVQEEVDLLKDKTRMEIVHHAAQLLVNDEKERR